MANAKIIIAFYGPSRAGDTIFFPHDISGTPRTYTCINTVTGLEAANHFYQTFATAYFSGEGYDVKQGTDDDTNDTDDVGIFITAEFPGIQYNFGDVVFNGTNGSGIGVTKTDYTVACTLFISGITTTPAKGSSSTGSIKVLGATTNAGYLPVEYSLSSISGWQTSSLFSNKAGGGYNVYIRDASGAQCMISRSVNVPTLPCTLILDDITVTHETEFLGKDGTATALYSGEFENVTFSLDSVNFQDSPTFVGLSPGPYTLYVKDDAGCLSQKSFTILEHGVAFTEVPESYLENDQFTISYQPELKSWTSFHSYIPNHYVSKGNRVFASINSSDNIYELNKGIKGVYFNNAEPQKFSIKLVVNPGPKETKKFDNIVVYTTSKNGDDEVYEDTFNTLTCYTTHQHTGDVQLVIGRYIQIDLAERQFKTKVELVNNEFRISIPRDLVFSTESSIFTEENWVRNPNYDSTPEVRKFRNQMQDKYLVVELQYDNQNNYELDLHTIKTLFRVVSR